MASRTLVMGPGQQVVLPVTAKIDAIILNGAISVSSTCDNLPAPSAQVCYKMEWSASVDAASNYTLEHSEARVNYIKVGGVQYNIGLDPTDNGGALTLSLQNIAMSIPGIFDFVSLTTNGLANRYDSVFLFKSIPIIAADIEMNITGDGFPTNGLFLRPYESTDCD